MLSRHRLLVISVVIASVLVVEFLWDRQVALLQEDKAWSKTTITTTTAVQNDTITSSTTTTINGQGNIATDSNNNNINKNNETACNASLLRFCRHSELFAGANVTDPNSTTATTTIHLDYQCTGPAYEQFAHELQVQAANRLLCSLPSRTHPLPANTTILAFGNSHLRLIVFSLACQYMEQIDRVEILSTLPLALYRIHFTNDATLYVAINFYNVYSPHWQRLVEGVLQRPLNDFDAILTSPHNRLFSYLKYTKRISKHLLQAGDEIDVIHHPSPSLEDLVRVYKGPVWYTSFFIPAGEAIQVAQAQRWMEQQQQNQSTPTGHHHHDNVVVYPAYEQPAQLGVEFCGCSHTGTCLELDAANDYQRQTLHPCFGAHGGHADVAAYVAREFLFRQLETTRENC